MLIYLKNALIPFAKQVLENIFTFQQDMLSVTMQKT
jgi:hypothetical protein